VGCWVLTGGQDIHSGMDGMKITERNWLFVTKIQRY